MGNLLRTVQDFPRQYDVQIMRALRALFSRCPVDSLQLRKECLSALKSLLLSDLMKGFIVYLSDFLQESIILGPQRFPLLRPVAYSILADYVNSVKDLLALQQMVQIIFTFSCVMHDSALPIGIQITAVRLMVGLVDRIVVLQQARFFVHCFLCDHIRSFIFIISFFFARRRVTRLHTFCCCKF